MAGQRRRLPVWGMALLVVGGAGALAVEEYKSGIKWPEPKVVEPGVTDSAPPSDAVVLFDGTDLSAFHGGDKWEVRDGYAIAKGGDITTKQAFGDCQLHIEWATPDEVRGRGQGRGNSGIKLMGEYEVQILDSYDNPTYYDGQAGAIYKEWPPLVNACRQPGQWQSFDIVFEAPRFDKHGTLTKPAYITVLQNGVAIQAHTELLGSTSYIAPPTYHAHPDKRPLTLQYHGDPVRFRNMWLRELHRPQPKYPDRG